MDKKQLLHEIAYYSNFINNHKAHWNPHFNKNVYIKPHFNPNSQFKYVKSTTQTASIPAVIKPVQNASTSTKVLINPNFKKPNVHINPHFNANRTILVNPKILSTPCFNLTETVNENPTIETSHHRKRRLSIRSQYKIVKSSCLKDEPTLISNLSLNHPVNTFSNLTTRKRRLSIRSKYKIVKSTSNQLKSPLLITPRKRTTSIHSTYKIVKSDVSKVKSVYKIDRRNTSIRVKSQVKKKVLSNGISDILRKNLFKNHVTWKKKLVINQFRSNNTRLTNISGILYKKSHTKLQKLQPTQKLNIKLKKNGHVSTPNKILRKCLTKERSSSKCTKNMKNSSISSSVGNTSRKLKYKERNKLQKNNIPCPVYRRYGQCRRKEAGRCIFLHNPNQIFLCRKFLQGACVDKDCLLSHKVSLEKMPTCKYFLEGCCTKNDCPYLHVKINPKADICRKFLEGFCDKGSECNLRHQFLCPDFERNGKCPKRKCVYPHKIKCDIKESVVKSKKKMNDNVKTVVVIEPVESLQIDRYYLETKTEIVINVDEKVNNENVDEQVKNVIEISTEDKCYKRPQLGELPAFIPF